MNYCPLCRGSFSDRDAVRTHLIKEHKRSIADADEMVAGYDIADKIPRRAPVPPWWHGWPA